MAREKSQYQFTTTDPAATNALIMQFLTSNGFELRQDGETQYYGWGNAAIGTRGFEYSIVGNQVVIYAYLGKPSHPMALTDGLVGAMGIAPYKAQLQPLFEQLQTGVTPQATPQSMSPASVPQNTSQPATFPAAPSAQPASTNFKAGTDKYAVIAFVFALIGLLTAALGAIYGFIPIIITFVLAASALQSNKRNLAIAAMVMSSISLLILLIWIILVATGIILLR